MQVLLPWRLNTCLTSYTLQCCLLISVFVCLAQLNLYTIRTRTFYTIKNLLDWNKSTFPCRRMQDRTRPKGVLDSVMFQHFCTCLARNDTELARGALRVIWHYTVELVLQDTGCLIAKAFEVCIAENLWVFLSQSVRHCSESWVSLNEGSATSVLSIIMLSLLY